MLRVHQLRLPLDLAGALDDALLRRLCAERLRVPLARVASARLHKRSVDARDKGDVHFALTVDVALTDAAEPPPVG